MTPGGGRTANLLGCRERDCDWLSRGQAIQLLVESEGLIDNGVQSDGTSSVPVSELHPPFEIASKLHKDC